MDYKTFLFLFLYTASNSNFMNLFLMTNRRGNFFLFLHSTFYSLMRLITISNLQSKELKSLSLLTWVCDKQMHSVGHADVITLMIGLAFSEISKHIISHQITFISNPPRWYPHWKKEIKREVKKCNYFSRKKRRVKLDKNLIQSYVDDNINIFFTVVKWE